MEKEKFQKLAEFFGVKINADAIEEVTENADMNYPDNWDQMSEEEKSAWKAKHEQMKGNSEEKLDILPARKPVQNARQAQSLVETPENIVKLNSLIDEVGGFDAFKGVLLNAVESVEFFQSQTDRERDGLVAAIVANSAGSLEEADLENVTVPALKKMAQAFTGHDVTVDYSILGSQTVKANQDDVAQMPDLVEYFQNQSKEAK